MNTIKQILFNTEMVRAILDGRKTCTRRVMKPQPILDGGIWELGAAAWSDGIKSFTPIPCHSLYNRMPYKPGDILYVPEAWKCSGTFGELGYEVEFRDGQHIKFQFEDRNRAKKWLKYRDKSSHQWQSPYFMPREAARLFLRVTGVRVERLQEITAEDALKEGVVSERPYFMYETVGQLEAYARKKFIEIWDSTIKKTDLPRYGWDANPWVWVINFEKISKEALMNA